MRWVLWICAGAAVAGTVGGEREAEVAFPGRGQLAVALGAAARSRPSIGRMKLLPDSVAGEAQSNGKPKRRKKKKKKSVDPCYMSVDKECLRKAGDVTDCNKKFAAAKKAESGWFPWSQATKNHDKAWQDARDSCLKALLRLGAMNISAKGPGGRGWIARETVCPSGVLDCCLGKTSKKDWQCTLERVMPDEFKSLRDIWFETRRQFSINASLATPLMDKKYATGKSGATFFNTNDGMFVFKKVNREESEQLRCMMEKDKGRRRENRNCKKSWSSLYTLAAHFDKTSRSLLNPFLALYKVCVMGKCMDPWVLMPDAGLGLCIKQRCQKNPDFMTLHYEQYDLKGPSRALKKGHETCRAKECKPDAVMSNDDFIVHHKCGFGIQTKDCSAMLDVLEKDLSFLNDWDIIDYSVYTRYSWQDEVKSSRRSCGCKKDAEEPTKEEKGNRKKRNDKKGSKPKCGRQTAGCCGCYRAQRDLGDRDQAIVALSIIDYLQPMNGRKQMENILPTRWGKFTDYSNKFGKFMEANCPEKEKSCEEEEMEDEYDPFDDLPS